MLNIIIFSLLIQYVSSTTYTLYPYQYLSFNNIKCNGQYNIDLDITSSNGNINYYFIPKATCDGIFTSYVTDLTLLHISKFNGNLRCNLNGDEYYTFINSENYIEPTVINIDSKSSCDSLSNIIVTWWIILIILCIVLLPCIICYLCYRKCKSKTNNNLVRHQVLQNIEVSEVNEGDNKI